MIRVFRRLRVTRQQSVSRLLFAVLVAASASCACARVDVDWGERFDLPGMGVARPFAGVSHGVVLLAGGSNFPDRPLVAGGAKVYHDEILMLDPAAAQPMWRVVGRLPRPQGEGGSATTAQGVVCVGGAVGRDGAEVASSAFVLSWDGTAVVQKPLPDVPVPLGKMPGVAAFGDVVYVTGSNVLWRIDLASDEPRWEEAREVVGLPAVFGEQPVLVAQKGRLFLFPGYDARTGRALDARFGKTFVGTSAVAVGDQHILFFGGADEAVWNAKPPPDRPVGDYRFAETIRAYSVVGDAWFELPGGVPRCGAAVVRLDDGRLLVAGGEVKPGVRTPESRLGTFRRPHGYSWVNVAVIAVYLAGMALMGVCFMRRNRSADDYFRAGGKLPWWVVSLSIYATMFSSITFISIPAMSYLDDCRYYVISFGILILAPVVAKWYLPFFRRLDLTSAYEFLEVRFNPLCRSFASAAFILFMVARTAIVSYLPAIAISAVTDIDINVAIVAVTVVTIFYCTIGGVEAVIWSDFVQSVILIGSTALILAFLVFGTDGGLSGFLKMGASAGKFRVFDFAFDWTKPCFWVVLVGGLVANLASYTSDQCVVQRYMTTPDEKGAAKSIIFNGVLSFVNCFVFFVLGVALWTFYKSHPALLDVMMPKNDAILPLFIGNDLPVGLSGLVLAAVAAATMSTLSANLNAAASAITVDFCQRYWMRGSRGSHKLLVCGKVSTVAVGMFGGAMALGLANADIGNVYDQFQRFLGVLTGGLGCLFFMGIFMRRVNGFGATCGLVANYAVCLFLDQVSFAGKPHLLLYGFLGLVACLIVAPLASRVRRRD